MPHPKAARYDRMHDRDSLQSENEDTHVSNVLLPTVDPFAPPRRFWGGFVNAILATAFFRCYHIIMFFTGWATCVTIINQQKIFSLRFEPTLITVIGTVIGFVISYRTTSSFERYNEGRRLWSQIILQSRTFARTVWFHIPDMPAVTPGGHGPTADELKARNLIEKKTVINLIEGFAVSVKHYLRGEEGTYYEDLWPLVKFLPTYALPMGLPPSPSSPKLRATQSAHGGRVDPDATLKSSTLQWAVPELQLPLPNNTSIKKRTSNVSFTSSAVTGTNGGATSLAPPAAVRPSSSSMEEPVLLPSRIPPKFSYFDVFPFSLVVRCLIARGRELKGRKAARLRAQMRRGGKRGHIVSHNVPLEITLYLSSYIAALQRRKVIDVPTTNTLYASLNGLVDALTGLERILTTPIPFSYSIHLWTVTTLYCLALPLQIWQSIRWLTIPATSILSFIFFGFLVAGEEIENPFGYDKNDLNMDHFTHAIIRTELMAITSLPTPDPADWAFTPLNDTVFDARNLPTDRAGSRLVERTSPEEWVARGSAQITEALSRGIERAGTIL